jgi:hypothetical protein
LNHIKAQCDFETICKPHIYSYMLTKSLCSSYASNLAYIEYTCVKYLSSDEKISLYYTPRLCNNKLSSIKCFPHHHIIINQVLYGMTKDKNCETFDSKNICVDSDNRTEKQTQKIKSNCKAKNLCDIYMEPVYFENCDNNRKGYTDVYSIGYYCEPGIKKMSIEVCNNQQLLRESKAMCPKNYKIIPDKIQLKYSHDMSCLNDICVEEEVVDSNNCRESYCDLRTYNTFSKKCNNYSLAGFTFNYECIPPGGIRKNKI